MASSGGHSSGTGSAKSGKITTSTEDGEREPLLSQDFDGSTNDQHSPDVLSTQEHDEYPVQRLRRKIDLRLCTIAGILCSLNLIDSGIISSASVTTMFDDLDLHGNRYSISIFIFTISSIAFQLPSTFASRLLGPRLFFPTTTFAFGLITFCTAFVHSWREMIALRVLLGMAMSGIYPGLTYLISTWYTRREQQLRFAYLQTGEVFVLATGGIVNFGLQQLDGARGLAGWRWMFLVQGVIAMSIGLATYFWIVDFPDKAHRSFHFLTADEQALALKRLDEDRGDVQPKPFVLREVLKHGLDFKIYGFAIMFFLLNIVCLPKIVSTLIIVKSRC